MKVVLFCGGYGMRMRDGERDVPKPMAMIGERPLLWHVMRYYAHYGHREFILCLGYGARHVTDYFLNYREEDSNDFVLSDGKVSLLSTDVRDWSIVFAHTGHDTPIGGRLYKVRHHLEGEEMFLANYADVLTDAPIDVMVDELRQSDAVANLLAVPPQSAFHVVDVSADRHRVTDIHQVSELPLRENGGYFVFRRELLDALTPDCDLVGDTLTELASSGKVASHCHDGFWMPADTVKERVVLDGMATAGTAPWELWVRTATGEPGSAADTDAASSDLAGMDR